MRGAPRRGEGGAGEDYTRASTPGAPAIATLDASPDRGSGPDPKAAPGATPDVAEAAREGTDRAADRGVDENADRGADKSADRSADGDVGGTASGTGSGAGGGDERASGQTSPRFLIAVLSAANFAIGLGAFVVIGVLNPIAESYSVSAARAGHVMTIYAVAYALGSPLLVALSGSLSRRRVLAAGLALFALGALGSALAPTLGWLEAARVLAALGAGVVTPITAAIAMAASAPGTEGRALARVFLGLTLAQVLGVPIGSWIGYTFGWPAAFALVVALSAATLAGVLAIVPRGLAFQVNTLGTLGAALADWRSVLSVLFTASLIGAIYVLYTYLAPLLAATMGYGRDGVSLVLVVFGAGAVIGNMLGGYLTDRLGAFRTLALGCGAMIVTMPPFSLLPMPDALLLALTLVWSVCGWAFMVAQQTRLVAQTPERRSVVLALNAAAIYVGVAIGSAVGAGITRVAGLGALGVGAGVFAAFALGHLVLSERLAGRPRPAA